MQVNHEVERLKGENADLKAQVDLLTQLQNDFTSKRQKGDSGDMEINQILEKIKEAQQAYADAEKAANAALRAKVSDLQAGTRKVRFE